MPPWEDVVRSRSGGVMPMGGLRAVQIVWRTETAMKLSKHWIAAVALSGSLVAGGSAVYGGAADAAGHHPVKATAAKHPLRAARMLVRARLGNLLLLKVTAVNGSTISGVTAAGQ